MLNISPFLTRELKVALRRPARGGRFVAACLVTGALMVTLPFTINFPDPTVGKGLFDILLLLGLIGVVMAGERASHLFAEERRNGTLGLLFSTGITPAEVLIGKLAGVLILPLSWLVTLVPGLVMVWLMQGATTAVCVTMLGILVALLCLTLSVNLFASLVLEEHSSARTFADAMLIFLVAAMPVLNWLNGLLTGTSFDSTWLALSPAYGPWMLSSDPRGMALQSIQLSGLYAGGISALLFAISAWRVGRMWKDQTFQTDGRLASHGVWARWQKRQHQKARAFLDSLPYQWLINRDFAPVLTSWLVLAGMILLWLVGWWKWGALWLKPMNFWATFVILGAAVKWMTNYIAAKQIGKDRASGALELLLTSTISVDEIVGGQRAAVRRYVTPFFWFMGIVGVTFVIVGLVVHPMQGLALMNYVVIWIAVGFFGPWFDLSSYWTSFWVSLNTGRPGMALRRQIWQKGAHAWIYVQVVVHRDKLSGIPSGSFAETCVVLIVGGGLLLCLFLYWMGWVKERNSLDAKAVKYMRTIAAEPVPEMSDPRLKTWDHNKPLFFDEPVNQKIMV